MSEQRDRARRQATKAASRAIRDANLNYKAVGEILSLSRENVCRRFGGQQFPDRSSTYGLAYTDLWMLSANPETAELTRLLLAPLLEQVERHSLRIADLDRLAANPNTTETARIALAPTAAMLWPDKFADTANPASSTEE